MAVKGRKPAEVASQEAYEEAGLVGQIVGKRPLGNFHYQKQLAKRVLLCEVRVFSFRVERQLDDWPEKGMRSLAWMPLNEAIVKISEPGVRLVLKAFQKQHAPHRQPVAARRHV